MTLSEKTDSPPKAKPRRRSPTKGELQLAQLAAMTRGVEAMADLAAITNDMVKRGESPNLPAAFATLLRELDKSAAEVRRIIDDGKR